eukprot:m.269025 g.269025  ORF g.269025 m.269025 type:complete len:473 (-) comp22816_c1_seq7:91-1509(-)
MYAAYQGHTAVVECLLQSDGCDVDAQDREGICALHWAALGGHYRIAQLLLQHGAYPNFTEINDAKATPLDYAYASKHQDVVDLLTQHGGLTIGSIRELSAISIQTHFRGYRVRRDRNPAKFASLKQEIRSTSPPPAAAASTAVSSASPAAAAAAAAESAELAAERRQAQLDQELQEHAREEELQRRARLQVKSPQLGAAATPDTHEQVGEEEPAEATEKTSELLSKAQARRDFVRREQQRLVRVRETINAATVIQRAFRTWSRRRRLGLLPSQQSSPQKPVPQEASASADPPKRSPSKRASAKQRAPRATLSGSKNAVRGPPAVAQGAYSSRQGGWVAAAHKGKGRVDSTQPLPHLVRVAGVAAPSALRVPVPAAAAATAADPRRHVPPHFPMPLRRTLQHRIGLNPDSVLVRNALQSHRASLHRIETKGWNDDTSITRAADVHKVPRPPTTRSSVKAKDSLPAIDRSVVLL